MRCMSHTDLWGPGTCNPQFHTPYYYYWMYM
jgi:hypothetical protein